MLTFACYFNSIRDFHWWLYNNLCLMLTTGIMTEKQTAVQDTIRYDTIDDLHWKTDRKAASLI